MFVMFVTACCWWLADAGIHASSCWLATPDAARRALGPQHLQFLLQQSTLTSSSAAALVPTASQM